MLLTSLNDIMEMDLEPILLIMVIIGGCLSVVFWIYHFHQKAEEFKDNREEAKSKKAKVISIKPTEDNTHNYVIFEFESGDRVMFKISMSNSKSLSELNEGILTYAATKFLFFEPIE